MAFSTSAHDHDNVLKFMILGLSLGLILIISSVVMVKVSFLPFSCEFVVGFWNSLRCFLSSPLYICIIINSMVLLIAALSTFSPPPPPPYPDAAKAEPPRTEKSSTPCLYQCTNHHDHDQYHDHDDYLSEVKGENEKEEDSTFPPSPPPPPPCPDTAKAEPPRTEKSSAPYLYQCINLHDHDTDQYHDHDDYSFEIKGENEKEEGDTMEATWKAISGVKEKHLRKSETFTHAEESSPAAGACTWKDLKKSETFNESVSIRRRGGMRRDPSIGIDEFNQQVEAFIKKFNDDMRLQRQQSDQRFIDMINRGI